MKERRPSVLKTSFGAGNPVLAIGLPRRPLGDTYHLLLTWSWVFGRRLADILEVQPDGSAVIDYRRFHDVEPLARPSGSPPA